MLVGQTELRNKLRLKKALASRIAIYSTLQPLSPYEMSDMISFRLKVAGGEDTIFPEESLERIYELSKGVPRDAVKICSAALELALVNRQQQVSTEIVETTAPEVQL